MLVQHRSRNLPQSALLLEFASAVTARMGLFCVLLKPAAIRLDMKLPWDEGGPPVEDVLDLGRQTYFEFHLERLLFLEVGLTH